MPIIKKHQTLIDFVTQQTGAASAWYDVAFNNGIGMTDDVISGTDLSVDIIDSRNVNTFINKEVDVTSLLPNIPVVVGGIGFMQIGYDFKVS